MKSSAGERRIASLLAGKGLAAASSLSEKGQVTAASP